MFFKEVRSAQFGAGHNVYTTAFQPSTFAPPSPRAPDAFERLPVNLSRDEIRTMVRDLLG